MGRLKLQNLTIAYGDKEIIHDLSLSVDNGEIVSLLGPSGAGKSTILKAVAGLLKQTTGKVFIDDQCVDPLPAEKRDTVLIFQKPLLFPYLDVWRNIEFGLKMSGCGRAVINQKISRILEITGLTGLEKRKIHQLSGGQQQRVALARGLVLEPSVLLLDEPLSSLDTELRQQMRELIRDVQQETGTTMLFVTHDQSEAFTISNRVCILLDGRLRQVGAPEELFYKPADLDVARFFGIPNMLVGSIENGQFIHTTITCRAEGFSDGAATAVIRPEDIELSPTQTDNCLQGTIKSKQFEGTATRLTIVVENMVLTAICLRAEQDVGDKVSFRLPPERLHLIPGATENER